MAEVDRSAATIALSAMQDEFPRARPVRSPPARGQAHSSTSTSSASSSQSVSLLDNKLSQEQEQSSSARNAESEEKRERAVRAEDAGEAAGAQGGAFGSAPQQQSTSASGLSIGEGALEPPSTPAGGAAGSPPSGNAATAAAGNTGRSKPDRGFKLDNFPGNDNKQRDQRGYSFGESRNSTRDMLLTPARDDMPFNMSRQ